MKKKFLPVLVALFAFMFALAAYGCGGSSAPADDAAAPDDAAVEQVADDAAATADEYADVNPDLLAIGEKVLPLSEEFVGLIEEAKTADDPSEYIAKINAFSPQLQEISDDVQAIDQSSLSAADEAYLNDVVLPALMKMLDGTNELAELL